MWGKVKSQYLNIACVAIFELEKKNLLTDAVGLFAYRKLPAPLIKSDQAKNS